MLGECLKESLGQKPEGYVGNPNKGIGAAIGLFGKRPRSTSPSQDKAKLMSRNQLLN